MPPAIIAIAPLIASLATAAAAVGGTAYSITAGQQQKGERQKAQQQQQSALAAAEQQKANQKQIADATLVRDRTRQLQKQAAGNAAGRAGTIVTGPLGVTGAAQGAGGKTLLGT